MPFNGESLLKRTLNQLHIKPYIVTQHPDIIDFCYANDALIFYPENNTKCVNTVLSTQSLWDDRVIILLGDVYYNQKCLDMTFNCNQDLCVTSNGVEIFSLSFVPSAKIVMALQTAAQHPIGKLWHFYRAYCGIEIDTHKRDRQGILSIPSDKTQDIDYWEDYIKLKAEVEK